MPKKLAKNHSVSTTSTSSSSSAAHPFLPGVLTDDLPLPHLIVFDLDYTLWPFWVDTHVTPPIKAASSSQQAGVSAAVDRFGESYAFYADVPRVLYGLPVAGVQVAAASRTQAPELAREMLKLLYVAPPPEALAAGGSGSGKKEKPRRALEMFDGGLEIYPGSKLRHMEALQKRTGVKYRDMLFFDDEARNREVEQLGVTMWLVRDGVSWDEIERGIWEWRKRRGFVQQ